MAGGLRPDADEDDPLDMAHEINVTPFIDVMLVLLIIFMLAAPLATVDIHVDLPDTNAAPQQRPDEPVYLTIQEDHSLAVNEDVIARDQLGPALDAATRGDREQRIFLRADKTVDYDTLMRTMNLMRDAGYTKIGLVALEDGAAP